MSIISHQMGNSSQYQQGGNLSAQGGIYGSSTLSGYGGTGQSSITWNTWPPTVSNELVIRKVENGYVLKHEGKEYIFVEGTQAVKFLELLGKTEKST